MRSFIDKVKEERGASVVDAEQLKREQYAKAEAEAKKHQEDVKQVAEIWLKRIQNHILKIARESSKNVEVISGQTPVFAFSTYYGSYGASFSVRSICLFEDAFNGYARRNASIQIHTYTLTKDYYEIWNCLSMLAKEQGIIINEGVIVKYFSGQLRFETNPDYVLSNVEKGNYSIVGYAHKSLKTNTEPERGSFTYDLDLLGYGISLEIPFRVDLSKTDA